jgi:urease accessory protein
VPKRLSAGLSANFFSRPDRVGRDGRLELAFVREADRTVLANRRFTHPLQALAPVCAPDGTLYLMMLNPSGGLVGGDRLRTRVEVGPQAGVALLTASAAKVYRTKGAPAEQSTEITLHPGATLEYLPDHVIPHPGAILHQSLHVTMGAGSRAIIYDALAAGRVGRGERWLFAEINSIIRVSRGAKPLYLSRSRIVPGQQDLDRLGWLEGFNYLATMLVLADEHSSWPGLAARLEGVLREIPGVSGGVSETAAGCVVRFMTADGLAATLASLWGVARQGLLGRQPFKLRRL